MRSDNHDNPQGIDLRTSNNYSVVVRSVLSELRGIIQ